MTLPTKLALLPQEATSLSARLELDSATRDLAQATARLAALRLPKTRKPSLASTYFSRATAELKASR